MWEKTAVYTPRREASDQPWVSDFQPPGLETVNTCGVSCPHCGTWLCGHRKQIQMSYYLIVIIHEVANISHVTEEEVGSERSHPLFARSWCLWAWDCCWLLTPCSRCAVTSGLRSVPQSGCEVLEMGCAPRPDASPVTQVEAL